MFTFRIVVCAIWCYTSSSRRNRRLDISNIQLQINEVARRTSVSIRTVRFYEEKGLLEPSAYTSGGIRLYTVQDVNRLIFIRRLTVLGMTLEEIKLCLGSLPKESDRTLRAERTLELLRLQKEKVAEEQAKLIQLDKDVNDALSKVSKCLNCRAEQCPEQCPSYGQVL